jgi:hypothetical protein
MSKETLNISNELIESFLEGTDPQKYIVAVEAGYNEGKVTLVVNDPETGKRMEDHKFKPFYGLKRIYDRLYDGARMKRIAAGENTVLKS